MNLGCARVFEKNFQRTSKDFLGYAVEVIKRDILLLEDISYLETICPSGVMLITCQGISFSLSCKAL